MTKKENVKVIGLKLDEYVKEHPTASNRQKADFVIDTFLDEIKNTILSGEKYQITGFGVFESFDRKEKVGRNPKTGETKIIPGYRVPKFKFSSSIKNEVKGRE